MLMGIAIESTIQLDAPHAGAERLELEVPSTSATR